MPSTLFLAMGESWFGHGEYSVEEMWYKEWHYCVKGQFQTQWLHHYQGKPVLQGLHPSWAAYHTGRGGECYLRKSWVSESLGRLFISLEILLLCVFFDLWFSGMASDPWIFKNRAWQHLSKFLIFQFTGLEYQWEENAAKLHMCMWLYVWNVKPC